MKKILEILLIFVLLFSAIFVTHKVCNYFESQIDYINEMTKLVELQNEYIHWILNEE